MGRFIERSVGRAAQSLLGSEGSRQAQIVDRVAESTLARKATGVVVPVVAFGTLAAIGTLDARTPRKDVTNKTGKELQQELDESQRQQEQQRAEEQRQQVIKEERERRRQLLADQQTRREQLQRQEDARRRGQ